MVRRRGVGRARRRAAPGGAPARCARSRPTGRCRRGRCPAPRFPRGSPVPSPSRMSGAVLRWGADQPLHPNPHRRHPCPRPPAGPRCVPAPSPRSAAAAIVVGATPAFAHVTAQPTARPNRAATPSSPCACPPSPTPRAPSSSRSPCPIDHPITSVRTTPRAGWTATMTKAPLNPPHRDATDARSPRRSTPSPGPPTRAPGSGPASSPTSRCRSARCPTDTNELVLPAVQTYDDGEVVAWDQPPAADGSEPERPAPTVTLTPRRRRRGRPHRRRRGAHPAPARRRTDTTARWLGGAGLLVGALGLGVGAGARAAHPAATGGDR